MNPIQHDPQSLAQMYLGPKVPLNIRRKCLPYSDKAPSYVPRGLLLTDRPPNLPPNKSLLSLAVEWLTIKPPVTPELLTNLSGDLKNHLENRVQLFLQQMLLVYKTKLHFDLYTRADLQVGKIPSKQKDEPMYVAAHSGTLPTLRFVRSNGASVSFAKDTSFYNGWNTTVYLPEVANQADSAIDRLVLNNATLRSTATKIFNEVSAGTLCPKDGLRNFLSALIGVLAAVQNGTNLEQRKTILENYSGIAKNYYDNIDNGYPLLQKLCLRPITAVVDDSFYMSVQADMHKQLKSELQRLQPEAANMPQLPADLNVSLLQKEIVDKVPKINSRAAQEYIQLCIRADRVRAAALQYFISLHRLTPARRTEDLNSILTMNLSEAALPLYNAAIEVIRSQVESPRNMPYILLSIMTSVGNDLAPVQPAPVQVPLQPQTDAKAQLRSLIEAKKQAMNVPSAAVDKYVKLCARTQKVREAAQSFFEELLHLPDAHKEIEVGKLFPIEHAKIKSVGLSPKAFTLYKEVLSTCGKNPHNTHLILSRLLLN